MICSWALQEPGRAVLIYLSLVSARWKKLPPVLTKLKLFGLSRQQLCFRARYEARCDIFHWGSRKSFFCSVCLTLHNISWYQICYCAARLSLMSSCV